MRPGRHAAGDASFARSAGGAMGRGVLLLVVALVLGIVLLQQVDDTPTEVTAGGLDTTETTDRGDAGVTTSTTARPAATTTTPLRAPRDIKVITANGTKVKGAAGRVRDRLLAAQYNVVAATDAKAPATASVVQFGQGFDREAAVLAQALGLPPTAVQPMPNPPPVADLRGASIAVIVGPELANQPAPAGGGTTSTTARAATSTTAKPATTTTTR